MERVFIFDLPNRRQLATHRGGVLGYIAGRYFGGSVVDVRTCMWEGNAEYMVIDDCGISKALPPNRIASECYGLSNAEHPEWPGIRGLALIVEQLSVHATLAKDQADLDLDVDAAVRGCTCDYCVYTMWQAGIELRNLPSVTCPNCKRKSYHPMDIANKYCAACSLFWGEILRREK
jgi:hypothetical protein